MDSYGYEEYEDEFDGSLSHEAYGVRRGTPQQTIHMTQKMTTKIPLFFDGKSGFFAFEDAIDDWLVYPLPSKTWTEYCGQWFVHRGWF